MSSAHRLLSALSFLAVLPACIAFPVGLGGEDLFPDDQLVVIEIGKSTKEDVVAAMAEPIQFLDGNIWLYARAGESAGLAYAVLIPGEGRHGVGHSGVAGGGDGFRFLMIKFDDSGVVAGYERSSSSSEDAGCNRSGVCHLLRRTNWHTYMIVAPEEKDRAIKQFDQPGDQCGIYVFGKSLKLVHFTLDGRQIGSIFDKKHFIFEQTDPGTHRLTASQVNGPIKFTCSAGSSVFLEVDHRFVGVPFAGGHLRVEVTQTDASEGRQAIAKRDWIVTPDSME